FFFFQAEDGIRDFHVTGVQTCALPIYSRLAASTPAAPSSAVRASWPSFSTMRRIPMSWEGESSTIRMRAMMFPIGCVEIVAVDRSEERRVGKEGRSRRPAEGVRSKDAV